eukprot:CAMPEP_0167758316 /NCGR_PEP_ID=MMETSP0110_2-20121227/10403_1 /TAXON_ID=629695 /ORGANISM="Gymnochlora sp., Strain CCMP2014" /LENGTH=254 /DNA_ID=CAMNT_0007644583 /DNA_START=81 /DNA_END=845 /DNA_ORIENTATION=+
MAVVAYRHKFSGKIDIGPVEGGRRERKERKGGNRRKKRGGRNRREEPEEAEEDEEARKAREERRRQEQIIRARQREAMRQYEDELAAARKKKADAYAAKLAAKREKREAERQAIEKKEAIRKQKEMEEMQAIYDKWIGKADEIDDDEKHQGGKLKISPEERKEKLLHFVKNHKVIVFDVLAYETGMEVKEVVKKLQSLEKGGKLLGVMDETEGKYIQISEDELKKVADFINREGKVSVDSLMSESSKLLDLSST